VRAAWPLLRPKGRIIALKGHISAAEMNALRDALAGADLGEDMQLEPLAIRFRA